MWLKMKAVAQGLVPYDHSPNERFCGGSEEGALFLSAKKKDQHFYAEEGE
jgi:hypothetical protein